MTSVCCWRGVIFNNIYFLFKICIEFRIQKERFSQELLRKHFKKCMNRCWQGVIILNMRNALPPSSPKSSVSLLWLTRPPRKHFLTGGRGLVIGAKNLLIYIYGRVRKRSLIIDETRSVESIIYRLFSEEPINWFIMQLNNLKRLKNKMFPRGHSTVHNDGSP